MNGAGEAFWSFSLALYGRPGVSPACLVLQDRHGCDVNLVLYACWIAASGRGRLSNAAMAAADATATPWRRAVVEPLRAARRGIKAAAEPGSEALYAQAKAVELGAEQVAQRRLAALAPAAAPMPPSASQRIADAEANLALCLDLAGGAPSAAAAPILAALRAMIEEEET